MSWKERLEIGLDWCLAAAILLVDEIEHQVRQSLTALRRRAR